MESTTALITGASSGIGFELARVMARGRIDLVLVARSADRLEELKKKLEKDHGVKVHVSPRDLSQPSQCEELFKELTGQGIQVDILVNNAGFGDYGGFARSDWNKDHQMIELNITALTYLTKLFLNPMLERKRGKIMNVASTAAFQAGPLMAVYFATKAYVLSFSEALANELRGTGVTVTTLCPGPTESGFIKAAALGDSKLVKGRRLPSSRAVAEFGFKALMKNQTVAVHGFFNKMLIFSQRFAPRKLVVQVVRKFQDAH